MHGIMSLPLRIRQRTSPLPSRDSGLPPSPMKTEKSTTQSLQNTGELSTVLCTDCLTQMQQGTISTRQMQTTFSVIENGTPPLFHSVLGRLALLHFDLGCTWNSHNFWLLQNQMYVTPPAMCAPFSTCSGRRDHHL